MPSRVRLRRTAGWRKPEGAVVVSRPARWGNPFPVAEYGQDLAVEMFRMAVTGLWSPDSLAHLSGDEYRAAADRRDAFQRRIGGHPLEAARAELAGRDLCCWCGPGVACHADVLLEVSNS